MPEQHSRLTIISMAVIALGITVFLHEGIGHGLTAWLLGDIPTELTSNHLSTVHQDRWVDAGGTIINLLFGAIALIASHAAGERANLRYFFWLLAAKNLFAGSGYFLFSGVFGFGDWQQVIEGMPHQAALRIGMSLFGAALYVLVARLLAGAIRSFVPERKMYNVVGRLPYLAACVFSCIAGAFDPLGLKLFFVSTVPAAFGGNSGMLWLDSLMPEEQSEATLIVRRSVAWWVAAVVFGVAYILILGRGVHFPR